jgi:hypothetical protein
MAGRGMQEAAAVVEAAVLVAAVTTAVEIGID